MTVTGLLRILFRWKRAALWTSGLLALAGLVAAVARPLAYEAQAILERKPAKLSPLMNSKEGEEFDVYRLTSESQRSVALLKSRYMLGRWYDAIGLPAHTPLERERGMNRLFDTLTVQPISYTDLFVVKARAFSPEEARRRTALLIDLFSQWDLAQDRQEAQQLVGLLQDRMRQVLAGLAQDRQRLQTQKAGLSLSLMGSASARQLEADISAKNALYDQLTSELEGAERQLRNDALPRTRVLAPPVPPGKPVFSRSALALIALCASLLAGLAMAALLEWQDPTIRRAQDIVRETPPGRVLTLPDPLGQDESAEPPSPRWSTLVDTVAGLAGAKKPVVIQFAGLMENDGHSAVAASFLRALRPHFRACLISQPAAEPLQKQIRALSETHEVIVVDQAAGPEDPPGSRLAGEADLACLVLAAGRTTRQALRAARQTLERLRGQGLVFILNDFHDPLPPWLRS